MPLYNYTCEDCGNEFEALISRPAAPATAECPKCASGNVTRALSLPAKTTTHSTPSATNCRGDGPPCGAPWCGRGGA